MRIDVLTLFPEMFAPVLNESILGRAQKSGALELYTHNIRDYAANKHKNADDYPFGGGAGMLMMAQPILSCMEAVTRGRECYRVYLSPRGRVLNQSIVKELSQKENLVLLCGHYEGIDERAMSVIDDEISIGDYVLTGGELPAMVLIDCVSRYVKGVLGSDESTGEESFSDGLLEYPQYTRPAELENGMRVPEILLNGHHANINKWRRQESLKKTFLVRPELLEKAQLTKEDLAFLETLKAGEKGLQ